MSPENSRLRRGKEQRAPEDGQRRMAYEEQDFLGVTQLVPDIDCVGWQTGHTLHQGQAHLC